jgi:hypothetical protein
VKSEAGRKSAAEMKADQKRNAEKVTWYLIDLAFFV